MEKNGSRKLLSMTEMKMGLTMLLLGMAHADKSLMPPHHPHFLPSTLDIMWNPGISKAMLTVPVPPRIPTAGKVLHAPEVGKAAGAGGILGSHEVKGMAQGLKKAAKSVAKAIKGIKPDCTITCSRVCPHHHHVPLIDEEKVERYAPDMAASTEVTADLLVFFVKKYVLNM